MITKKKESLKKKKKDKNKRKLKKIKSNSILNRDVFIFFTRINKVVFFVFVFIIFFSSYITFIIILL
jgi:hypothetical protein